MSLFMMGLATPGRPLRSAGTLSVLDEANGTI